MKVFKRILIGCLGLGVLALVILAVTAGVMLTLGPPETAPGDRAALEQPITAERLPAPDPAPGEVALPALRASVRLNLDLEEGEFLVRPGKPGEGIRVEGRYDSGLYDLSQEVSQQGDVQVVDIRFASKYSFMRRLLTMGHLGEPEDNRIEITVPPDVVLQLAGSIRKGESDVDLSGLAVAGIDLELAMGEHRLAFERPNQISMEDLRLRTSMGEFHADRLGNAHFREARIDGSMGELDVDLEGDYREDAVMSVRFRMGECRISVPADINVNASRTVFLGEASGRRRDRDHREGLPTLTVKGSVSMGELRID